MKKWILLSIILATFINLVTFTTGGCKTDEPVLYIGFMVHLEGWDQEVTNQDMFMHHAEAARELASIFEEYEAKITFEARSEFVEGCMNWNDNVLLELYNRGHGIGVHADVGGGRENLTQLSFASQISIMKQEMERLTGLEILHVSGICSELDWVKAGIDAGYKFATGTIGYCAMSMPVDERPLEYRDCPNPGECHGVIPVELVDRVNPWKTSTGRHWLEHDPGGEFVILSESGVLENLAEYVKGEGSSGGEFTRADIDVYIEMLEEALTYTKDGQTTFLYVGLSIGSPEIHEYMYKEWLAAIKPYVDSGQVEWKTLPEIYSAYLE